MVIVSAPAEVHVAVGSNSSSQVFIAQVFIFFVVYSVAISDSTDASLIHDICENFKLMK